MKKCVFCDIFDAKSAWKTDLQTKELAKQSLGHTGPFVA